jgi:polar amino acid transport system permease protein
VESVEQVFRTLDDVYGVNLTIGYDAYDRARFLEGLLTTLELSVICILLSLAIGVLGAWVQGARSRLLRGLIGGYIAFFRNTPPLIQLYFFYFAIGAVLPQLSGDGGLGRPLVSNFGWAVISLAFFAGAFNVEIFRSGIEAVPRSTVEAAESLGYTRLQIYRHVVLPLAFRVCLPALNNNLVNLVKTTTLAYAIAVPELLYMSNQIWSDSLNVPEMMVTLLLVYVALVAVLVAGMHRWERAMRIPGFGR